LEKYHEIDYEYYQNQYEQNELEKKKLKLDNRKLSISNNDLKFKLGESEENLENMKQVLKLHINEHSKTMDFKNAELREMIKTDQDKNHEIHQAQSKCDQLSSSLLACNNKIEMLRKLIDEKDYII
jgi:chromosome segregation ATPase